MNDQIQKIFALTKTLKSSSGETLNETSGGGDPEVVSKNWKILIEKHLEIPKNSKILDYGCGVGRLAMGFLEDRSDLNYLGVDIVPEFIEFARKYITDYEKKFKFALIGDSNALYQKYITSKKENSTFARFQDLKFFPDFIFALSLFSHLNTEQTAHVLKNISFCMHDDSVLFLTAFIIDVESKEAMKQDETFPFKQKSTHFHESYLEDDYNGPQSAIGFERSTLEQLLLKYDLVISQKINGYWRGARYASRKSLQDILVVEKRAKIPDDFRGDLYLERHEDVKNSGMNPKFHWLAFGFDEKRT